MSEAPSNGSRSNDTPHDAHASDRDADTQSADARVIAATLALAAEEGWRDLPLKRIARRAGMPLSAVYRRFRSRTDILRAYGRQLDAEVLDEPLEDEDRPRDRLFDIVMARFEAMQPDREALWVIWHDVRRDPVTLAALAPDGRRSTEWLLEAAGIGTDGWRGAVRVRLVMVALARTFGVWLEEESADLPKTMAELDKRLRGIEDWLDPRRAARAARDGEMHEPRDDLPAARGAAADPGHKAGNDQGHDPAEGTDAEGGIASPS